MSDQKKRDALLKEAVENVTEEELQEIAAAGDTNPEATPVVISVVSAVTASVILGCKK